jgi:6,7-dimethyl-8-ribityllumazine synthase
LRLALIVSDFNFDVTSLMLDRARSHAGTLGVEVSHEVHVPGVFDMGPAIKKLLKRKDVDAVVLIGAVIKGDTKHDEVVVAAAANAAVELSLEFDKPVALGVTGPGMTHIQALDRVDNAKRAVESAVSMVRLLRDIGDEKDSAPTLVHKPQRSG